MVTDSPGRGVGNVPSDVEQPYPGRADMELIIIELGLNNHVPTATEIYLQNHMKCHYRNIGIQ